MSHEFRRFGITLNMDYENRPAEMCRMLFDEITDRMVERGFHFEKRMFMFTTEMDKQQACEIAREVVESLESHKEFHEHRVYSYIKDFFAVEMTDYVDLMLPDVAKGIEVEEEFGEDN